MTKDELLLGYTGHDSTYWVDHIQALIRIYFDAEPDNPHPECDPEQWMHALTSSVVQQHAAWMAQPLAPRRFERFRKARLREPYDGNISSAYCVVIILTTWSVRLSRAKAHDARRPLDLRRKALDRNRAVVSALYDAIYDETRDAEYFDLPWQYPYMAGATSGDFI